MQHASGVATVHSVRMTSSSSWPGQQCLNLDLITLTLGLGTDLAIRAGILYLFAHALFKAGLFITVGGIDHAAHTRLLSNLGGLHKKAPALFWFALILCGSMAGLPPFAGFLSKELVLEKLMLAAPLVHDVAVVAIVLGSIGTVAYTARFFFGTFGGAPRSEGASSAHSPGFGFLLAPAVLAVLSLLAGVGAQWVDIWFLEPVSWTLVGAPIDAPQLALWHGITVPLLLTAVILTAGWFLFRTLDGRRLPSGPQGDQRTSPVREIPGPVTGIGRSIEPCICRRIAERLFRAWYSRSA